MANMTPQEQLMLELLNRARMDPAGEAKRFKIGLNEGVPDDKTISTAPKQVLAGNDDIAAAADKHSKWILKNDNFSHYETSGTPGYTGDDPGDRMEKAGYTLTGSWAWGENISVRGSDSKITDAMKTEYITLQHADLFKDIGFEGRGHRVNMLNGAYEEAGMGQQFGKHTFDGQGVLNSSMVTQDFGTTGTKVFVTGVVYDDKVIKDNFFSVGEQVVNRTVSSAGAVTDETGAGGGYELLYTAGGDKSVQFDLAGGKVTVGLTLGSTNTKLDVVNGKEVWSDHSISSVSSNVKELHALGIGNVDLAGASGSQKLFGNSGENILKGNGGNDTLDGGAGIDDLYGGAGHDSFVFYKGDTGKTKATADTIFDFGSGDTINLSHWDANSSKAGDQDFTFIGSAGFHDKAGELRVVKESSDTWIYGDTNGDGKVDLVLHLDDAVALKAGHFDL